MVDDNSPDSTGVIAQKLSLKYPQVHVIHREKKLGLGTAYLCGFEFALGLNADYIITMDADFSHCPAVIPQLVEKMRDYDIVIGSRYIKGGKVKNWGVHRTILSRSANLIARATLKLAPRDCTAGFRCYRTESLQSLDFSKIRSNGYSFLVETIYILQKKGLKIGEVPITFTNRTKGVSKISKTEIFKAILTLIRLKLKSE